MNEQETRNYQRQHADDEIDLVDLFLILLKRKWLIGLTTALCILLGGGYLLYKTENYQYVTTLQIGTLLEGVGEQAKKSLIETPEIVKVKLDSVYIPQAVKKLMDAHDGRRIKAESNVQKDSNILLIKSNGAFEDESIIRSFHTQVVDPVLEEHQRIMSASMKEFHIQAEQARLRLKELKDPQIYLFEDKVLQNQIGQAQAKLVELNDQKQLLMSKEKRLIDTQRIVNEQIQKVEKNLDLAYAERPEAKEEVNDEAKALTFLMLNSQIEQNERQLADLKERSQVTIEDQKQVLENKLSENRRQHALQKEKISELQSKLKKQQAERLSSMQKQQNVIDDVESKIDLYHESRVLGIAQRSFEPEGPGKSLILALSGILGLMGGLMLAFIAEFMAKVRQQQRMQEEA